MVIINPLLATITIIVIYTLSAISITSIIFLGIKGFNVETYIYYNFQKLFEKRFRNIVLTLFYVINALFFLHTITYLIVFSILISGIFGYNFIAIFTGANDIILFNGMYILPKVLNNSDFILLLIGVYSMRAWLELSILIHNIKTKLQSSLIGFTTSFEKILSFYLGFFIYFNSGFFLVLLLGNLFFEVDR